jgi:hypothetical protein
MSRHIIKSFVSDAAKVRVVLNANFVYDELSGYSVRVQSNFFVNATTDEEADNHTETAEHFLVQGNVGMNEAYDQANARFREIVLPMV